MLAAVFGTVARRTTNARALLREVRASSYRKLFLAFVAAAVVPVVALALVSKFAAASHGISPDGGPAPCDIPSGCGATSPAVRRDLRGEFRTAPRMYFWNSWLAK
jgi:hypothetical protein